MVRNHQRDFFGAIVDVVTMNPLLFHLSANIKIQISSSDGIPVVLLQSNRQVVWLAFPVMGGKNDCFNHNFTIFSRRFPGIFPFPSTKQHGFGCALTWFQRMTSKDGCREQINKTITGWWFQPTPLKKYESQLEWWHSQLNGKNYSSKPPDK